MGSGRRGIAFALCMVRLATIILAVLLACNVTSRAEEKTIPPCREDAMVRGRCIGHWLEIEFAVALVPRARSIVFDASGSMSGNETLGIPNSRARIDEARSEVTRPM
jgi:hypothetical protein